jgi:hypothetical protein
MERLTSPAESWVTNRNLTKRDNHHARLLAPATWDALPAVNAGQIDYGPLAAALDAALAP